MIVIDQIICQECSALMSAISTHQIALPIFQKFHFLRAWFSNKMFVRMLAVHYYQNDSNEITINGLQARKL